MGERTNANQLVDQRAVLRGALFGACLAILVSGAVVALVSWGELTNGTTRTSGTYRDVYQRDDGTLVVPASTMSAASQVREAGWQRVGSVAVERSVEQLGGDPPWKSELRLSLTITVPRAETLSQRERQRLFDETIDGLDDWEAYRIREDGFGPITVDATGSFARTERDYRRVAEIVWASVLPAVMIGLVAWFPVLLCFLFAQQVRTFTRSERRACINCGYQLHGGAHRCPECGVHEPLG